ncbi:hypothetical protein Acsp04_07350 [Actinomadura sp. NBRC 104425]|nr:hypothetical protein Acsp04_07350 [Actinomadura sp. NBRC 104425]
MLRNRSSSCFDRSSARGGTHIDGYPPLAEGTRPSPPHRYLIPLLFSLAPRTTPLRGERVDADGPEFIGPPAAQPPPPHGTTEEIRHGTDKPDQEPSDPVPGGWDPTA